MGLRESRADLRARFSRYSENECAVEPRVRGALDLRHTRTYTYIRVRSLVHAAHHCSIYCTKRVLCNN